LCGPSSASRTLPTRPSAPRRCSTWQDCKIAWGSTTKREPTAPWQPISGRPGTRTELLLERETRTSEGHGLPLAQISDGGEARLVDLLARNHNLLNLELRQEVGQGR